VTRSGPQAETHAAFDSVEQAFHAALDTSLDPRGPESLFDLVSALALPPGASVVDVGCGRGRQSVELARRFGFEVLGVDPVARQETSEQEVASDPPALGTVVFAEGTAEAIPVEDSSTDLIFCRESLMYTDLEAATSEFHRVLRPGGCGLVYLVLTGPQMSDAEADTFNTRLGSNGLRPSDIEQALTEVGLRVDERVDYGSEWGERAQEREGTAGRRLLYAARLLRRPGRYITQFGQDNYDIMLGDCLWHVYRLLGKVAGYACTFTKVEAG